MATVTAATLHTLIAAGRIVEAGTLLTMEGDSLDAEEVRACTLAIEQRQTKAAALVVQAEAMERAGKIEEAKALYESVLEVAVDFPGIEEHINRTNEALLLTRAVQRRSQRTRQSSPARERTGKKRARPLLGAVLAAGLAAAALVLLLRQPQPPQGTLPEHAAPEPAPMAAPQPAVAPLPPAAPEPVPLSSSLAKQPLPPDPEPIAVQQSALIPATPPTPAAPQERRATAEPAAAPPIGQHTPSSPLPPPETLPATAPRQPMAEEPERRQPDLYTVQPGDSLSLIAKRRLCHEPSWHHIYQRHRDQIADPRRLQAGMVLNLTGMEHRCPATP